MGAVFSHQLRHLLRDRGVMAWSLVFPLVLSTMFMLMFGKLESKDALEPMPIGVVDDAAYAAAPGLDAVVSGLAAPSSSFHFAQVTRFDTPEQARQAAKSGQVLGYLVVEQGSPRLLLSRAGNAHSTSLALRSVLDSYAQGAQQTQLVLSHGGTPQDLGVLQARAALTKAAQLTQTEASPMARYYFALLAMSAGMGTSLSMIAVRAASATAGPLGARRTLAGVPRWRVAAGVLGASWLVILASQLITYAYMVGVVGVNFGAHPLLAVVAISLTSLMACGAGAALGTVRKLESGMVSGLVSLLSLFTGLYGDGSMRLADWVEVNLPWLAQLNPLWQSSHTFYSLLYYDSLAPFAYGCAALAAMTTVFMTVAVIRMRRMSHVNI